MIEPFHFLALQWNVQNWFKGQIFNLFINILIVGLWYVRLDYLNSPIAVDNERYLMNFQYLNGFVTKPKRSLISKLLPVFSLQNILAIFSGMAFILIILYIIKTITFYLLLNTVFIMIIVFFALFFSLSSVKRDWHNQLNLIIKKK
jgi:hypothetical protein